MKYETEGETRFGIKPFVHGSEIETDCSDNLCPRKINKSENCFLDLLSGEMLCEQCGKCLRYARKKAHQRGEPIETAEV